MSEPIAELRRQLSRYWLATNVAGRRNPYRRFILGINMEACRRKNKWDLARNNISYRYDPSGTLELTFTTGWLSLPGNSDLLHQDLQNIADMGASVIRVFVFEDFEGLDFTFTTALMNARRDADNAANAFLHCRVFPEGTIHVCTKDEFQSLKVMWGVDFEVSPSSNASFTELLANAETLQRLAGSVGLRVLWTLWLQFGEAVGYYPHYPDLIFYSDDRDRRTLQPRRSDNADKWITFYQSSTVPDRKARLPIEAWIYRELMTNVDFRNSYIDNALEPFIERMEQGRVQDHGEAVGYEIMNEADTHWEDCRHAWTNAIKGAGIGTRGPDFDLRPRSLIDNGGRLEWRDHFTPTLVPNLLTQWKMSAPEIQAFLMACQARIEDVFGRIHGDRHRKLVFSGVLGTQDDHTQHELSVVEPLNALLSGSAITRYSVPNGWVPWNGGSGVHDVRSTQWLWSPCVFLEAGDNFQYENSGHYNCDYQKAALRRLLVRALGGGYAAVLVWHYGDPARTLEPAGVDPASPDSEEKWNQNALTEFAGASGIHELVPGGHALALPHGIGRPAIDEIRLFAFALDPLLLPKIPPNLRPPPP